MPTTGFNEMNIRPEPTHHTESYTDRNTYKQNNYENKQKIVTNTTMSMMMMMMKIKNIPNFFQKK